MGEWNKDKHLQNFNDVGSSLVSKSSYEAYMEGKGTIGFAPTANDPQGSMFVAPKEEIDRVLKEANGDIAKVEKTLGLPEGHFGDGPLMRVDIHDIHNQGLRVANGYESGANEYWNTKADSQGNLPNIIHVKDADGKSTGIVDTTKTDPSELNKLNGQYWDEKGNYHKPNQEGYDGKTSTGINEGVINRVPNNAENVTYSELKGFLRGESANVTSKRIQDGYSPNNSPKDNIEKQGGSHSNAPPAHGHKSDLSDANTLDKAGEVGSQGNPIISVKSEDLTGRELGPKESFQPVTQANIAGKERSPKEAFQPVTEVNLAKRNELRASKGTEHAAQAPAVSSGLKVADNTKSAVSGMGV